MKSSQGDSNPLDNNPLSGTRSKHRSISGYLAAGLIAITLLVSIVTITVIYFNAIREQEASLTRKADEYTQYLVGVLQDPLWDYNEESINTICRTFLQNELVISIVIKETSGRVVFSGKNSPDTDLIKRTGKIHSHSELLGEAEISFTRQYVKEAGRRLLVSYAVTMLFVSMSLVLLTHLLLRVFLKKPLDTLDKIAKPYVAGIYDSPIPELPYTEFQGFGNTLTQMGETIRLQMKELHLQTAELEEEIEKRQKAQDELERLNENLEQRVKERTAELVVKSDELEQKNRELERFNKLFVNRELRMIELKEKIQELEKKKGE